MTSGLEMERVYSYNCGACTGWTNNTQTYTVWLMRLAQRRNFWSICSQQANWYHWRTMTAQTAQLSSSTATDNSLIPLKHSNTNW